MIEIKGIKKAFGNFTLDIESLNINSGNYIVLLGNSGSGKTLLLDVLSGLVNSDEGSIMMDGNDLNLLPIQKRPFGLVFQDQALFPHMTVEENIAFALKGSGLKKKEIRERAGYYAKTMEIEALLPRMPGKLSGGEKQRVALARTLAKEPACLLLDEPLSALDARLRKEIRSVLRWLNRMGNTILHVTHDFEEAVNLASHIGVMADGKIVQFGPAEEVLKEPRSAFVANFTGIRNYFHVKLKPDISNGETIAWVDDKVPVRLSTDKTRGEGFVIVPSESIVLSVSRLESSAMNQFKGQITDISPGRHGIEVQISTDLPFVAQISRPTVKTMNLKIGQEIWMSFKAASVRFIRK